MDPHIEFKDPLLGDEHIINLNANLFNSTFLTKYREYTLAWMDLIDYRPENEVYSVNWKYQDDIMFLPKKYHECY